MFTPQTVAAWWNVANESQRREFLGLVFAEEAETGCCLSSLGQAWYIFPDLAPGYFADENGEEVIPESERSWWESTASTGVASK